MTKIAAIGIIGGSGVYELLDNAQEVEIVTPYSDRSVFVSLGEVAGKAVVFIARHGRDHSIPPHLVNYRANIYALHKLGVRNIISSGAIGSLRKQMKPGDIVVTDQFIDRTKGRMDTYIEGPEVEHLSAADLYCDNLRKLVIDVCKKQKITCHESGTVVVINGPRFSSRAESEWFKKMGWDILSMTQYPENVLAAELGICYCNIGLVTDYDVGIDGMSGIRPVTWTQIKKTLQGNAKMFKEVIVAVIAKLPDKKAVVCKYCPQK